MWFKGVLNFLTLRNLIGIMERQVIPKVNTVDIIDLVGELATGKATISNDI
jgi:hypothetical protein